MPKTSAKISFSLEDVTAKKDTVAESDFAQSFVDLSSLALSGVYAPKVATLEKNIWKLDGTFDAFPDSPENMAWGFWSNDISNEDCTFSESPVLKLFFSELHSAIGLSFEFDPYGNYYPSEVKIIWKHGENIIKEEVFYPDNWRYTAFGKVENYNYIEIIFLKTNAPYHYIKCQNIIHGVNKIFEDNEIVAAELLEETDLTGCKLSVDTLNFTVFSKNDEFNIFNPSGIYTLLQNKQQIVVEGSINDETKNLGIFYVDTLDCADENTLTVNTVDAVGIMDGTEFKGGMYQNVLADDIINEILTDAGFAYSLDSCFKEDRLTGYIPICSHRQALQMVAFALGAYVSTARSGTVNIKSVPSLDSTPSSTIGMNRKFKGTKVSLEKMYTGVSLTEHSYTLEVDDEGNAVTANLYEGVLTEGNNYIKFSDPAVEITSTAGVLTEYGVNYAMINSSSEQEVVVSGRRYIDNTKKITYKMEELPAGEIENISAVDCTLVSSLNSTKIAQQYFDMLQNRIKQKISIILDNETAGSIVNIETEYGIYRGSFVWSMETDLVNGFVSNIETRG